MCGGIGSYGEKRWVERNWIPTQFCVSQLCGLRSLAEFHFPIHEIKQVVHLTSTPLRF